MTSSGIRSLILLLALGLVGTGLAASKDTYQNPLDVIIADPFVLKSGGTYYLYGTTSASSFHVFSSTNLVDWRNQGLIMRRTKDSWAQHKFWAPECFEHHGKFYFHYTAAGEKTSLRIHLAVADTPLGPFKDLKTPWLDPGQAVIDSDVFRDDDGKLYLYYVLDCSENKYSEIRVCKLDDDLNPSKQSWFCTKPSQAWEGDTWNEGPCVVKHNGTYYMTYSGSAFFDPTYGLGYATAPSPLGPWTKAKENPVLQRTATAAGPGHNGIVASPDGKELFAIYHTLQNPGFNAARQLAMDRLRFVPRADRSGPDRLVIDGPTTDAEPFPSGAAAVVRGKNEDFSAPAVDRTLWTVFNEEPRSYSIKDGKLLIRTANGDVAERRDDQENLFLQYAPAGDFTATTHVTITPTTNYENAFLCVWQDHDNFIKVATVYSDKPRLEVAIETNARYDSHLFDNTLGPDVYLRVTRRGGTYSMAASADGKAWTSLMAGVRSTLSDLRVGIGAASPGTRESTTAAFDYLHFTTP